MFRDYGRNWRRNSRDRERSIYGPGGRNFGRSGRDLSRNEDQRRNFDQEGNTRRPINNYNGTPVVNRDYQGSTINDLYNNQQRQGAQNHIFTPINGFSQPIRADLPHTNSFSSPFSSQGRVFQNAPSTTLQNQNFSTFQNKNQAQIPFSNLSSAMNDISSVRNESGDQFLKINQHTANTTSGNSNPAFNFIQQLSSQKPSVNIPSFSPVENVDYTPTDPFNDRSLSTSKNYEFGKAINQETRMNNMNDGTAYFTNSFSSPNRGSNISGYYPSFPAHEQLPVSGDYFRMNERQKAHSADLMHQEKLANDQLNTISNTDKRLFPAFPKEDKNGNISPVEFMRWRSITLLTAQAICGMNNAFNIKFVPLHHRVKAPSPEDPMYAGQDVLFGQAQRVWETLPRNWEAIRQQAANVLIYQLRDSKTAGTFIKPFKIDAAQIFADLDATYFLNTNYTKGDYITSFFQMKRYEDERFSVFVVRLDSARMELSSLFNVDIDEDMFKGVMQLSLHSEMKPLYNLLNESGASLAEIRRHMIGIETDILRREAKTARKYDQDLNGRVAASNLADYRNRTWDDKHNRRDSPQYRRQNYLSEYNSSHFRSPSRSFDRSSRSPSHDRRSPTPYNRRDKIRNSYYGPHQKDDRDRSSSRSPNRGYNKPNFWINNKRSRYESGSRSDSPRAGNYYNRDRDRDRDRERPRSPSPGATRHQSGRSSTYRDDKRVKFGAPTAQLTQTEREDAKTGDTSSDDEHPDLRVQKDSTDREEINRAMTANAVWTRGLVGRANVATVIDPSSNLDYASVLPSDIQAWREDHPNTREWLSTEDVCAAVIEQRKMQFDDLNARVKQAAVRAARSEKRVADRRVQSLQMAIGKHDIGAEKPQRRPTLFEKQRYESHRQNIRRQDKYRTKLGVVSEKRSRFSDVQDSASVASPINDSVERLISSAWSNSIERTKRRRVDGVEAILEPIAATVSTATNVTESSVSPQEVAAVEPLVVGQLFMMRHEFIEENDSESNRTSSPPLEWTDVRDSPTRRPPWRVQLINEQLRSQLAITPVLEPLAVPRTSALEAASYPRTLVDGTVVHSKMDLFNVVSAAIQLQAPDFRYEGNQDIRLRLQTEFQDARIRELQTKYPDLFDPVPDMLDDEVGDFPLNPAVDPPQPFSFPHNVYCRPWCVPCTSTILPDIDSQPVGIFFTRTEWVQMMNSRQTQNIYNQLFLRNVGNEQHSIRLTHDIMEDHRVHFMQLDREVRRQRFENVPGTLWFDSDRQFRAEDRVMYPSVRRWPRNEREASAHVQIQHYYSQLVFEGSKMRNGRGEVCCDGVYNQIRYVTDTKCNYTWMNIDTCRCIFCLMLHTAKVPDLRRLEPSEYVSIRCMKGVDTNEPMRRRGVTSSEDRAEFVVQPIDRNRAPVAACNPRVYRVANRLRDGSVIAIHDRNLDKEDMYAEFEDPVNPKIRYVLGIRCRYTQEEISECTCGICDEMRYTYRDYDKFNLRDKFHYVRVIGYDLRASHVINSSTIHVMSGVDEWREAYLGGFARHNEARVDVEPFAAVITYECNANFNPFVDQSGASKLPGPFGEKEIVSDSGATRHLFHDIKQFSSYREVRGQRVRVADGQYVDVLGIGDVGPLKDVLHVPSLVYDLVSESCLDKYGQKLCITDEGVKTFYNKTEDGKPSSIFLVAQLNENNLYIVNPMYLGMKNNRYDYKAFCALASKAEAIDMLHKVLGHIHVERIQDMIKTGRVKWNHETAPVNLKKHADPCVACALAKSKRVPHTKRLRVPLEPGSLIYVDVWGPCEVISLLNENIYTIGFIDAATKRA